MAEHPDRPRDYDKIGNSLEKRAHLIVDALEDQAQRIVNSMDEPPPGTEEPDAETVRAMWTFSPYGTQAATVFWTLHDLALEKLLADIPPELQGDEKMKAIRAAYQTAEATTLGRVFPHRAALILLGITTPERSIHLAEKAQRLVDQEDKRTAGNTKPVEAMAYG